MRHVTGGGSVWGERRRGVRPLFPVVSGHPRGRSADSDTSPTTFNPGPSTPRVRVMPAPDHKARGIARLEAGVVSPELRPRRAPLSPIPPESPLASPEQGGSDVARSGLPRLRLCRSVSPRPVVDVRAGRRALLRDRGRQEDRPGQGQPRTTSAHGSAAPASRSRSTRSRSVSRSGEGNGVTLLKGSNTATARPGSAINYRPTPSPAFLVEVLP